jgi:exonuclease III
MVSLKMKSDTLYIFSVYAPEECKPKTEKDHFYETLQEHLDRIPVNKSVLIFGDLNARIGKDIVNGVKQRSNEDVIHEKGDYIHPVLCR